MVLLKKENENLRRKTMELENELILRDKFNDNNQDGRHERTNSFPTDTKKVNFKLPSEEKQIILEENITQDTAYQNKGILNDMESLDRKSEEIKKLYKLYQNKSVSEV